MGKNCTPCKSAKLRYIIVGDKGFGRCVAEEKCLYVLFGGQFGRISEVLLLGLYFKGKN